MDKRFTVKDFILFASIAGLLVLLVLTMYQIDRQWLMMEQMRRGLDEQGEDLRGLRGQLGELSAQLQRGVALVGDAAGDAAAGDAHPAFARARRAAAQPDYASGDWLVDAFGTGLKTISPLVSQDAYAARVQGYVLESLISRHPQTLEWQGLIARDWQISADGLTITFDLRDGVTFSDGAPLTAEDVAFSFRFIMDERIAAPRARAYFNKIASVQALGPLRVRFEFAEPYFNALSLAGGMSILPRHFYARFLDDAETFNQSKGLLLGSGPYRLADPEGWTPDQGLVELERNPRYWGPVQPPFERLLWKVIENDSARLTTFRNGEIDSYGARPREYRQLRDDPQLSARTRRFEYMSPTAGYSYIGWNQRRGEAPTRFADRRVREAMTLLTDRQRIIDEIYLGYAEPAISPFNPRSPQHDPQLAPRAYAPERARELLAEVGYTDRDGDGVLEDESGEPFSFELVYFQDNEDTKRMVLLLKDIYARNGILLEPKPTEWSVMLDLIGNRNFDAITLGWTSGVETDIFQMFHGSQTEDGGDNFTHFKSDQLDRLIDEARATVDEAARMPLWQAAERVMYEQQPYTFLMRRETLAFIDQRIHNLQNTRLGLNLGFQPVEVYVPAAMQKYRN